MSIMATSNHVANSNTIAMATALGSITGLTRIGSNNSATSTTATSRASGGSNGLNRMSKDRLISSPRLRDIKNGSSNIKREMATPTQKMKIGDKNNVALNIATPINVSSQLLPNVTKSQSQPHAPNVNLVLTNSQSNNVHVINPANINNISKATTQSPMHRSLGANNISHMLPSLGNNINITTAQPMILGQMQHPQPLQIKMETHVITNQNQRQNHTNNINNSGNNSGNNKQNQSENQSCTGVNRVFTNSPSQLSQRQFHARLSPQNNNQIVISNSNIHPTRAHSNSNCVNNINGNINNKQNKSNSNQHNTVKNNSNNSKINSKNSDSKSKNDKNETSGKNDKNEKKDDGNNTSIKSIEWSKCHTFHVRCHQCQQACNNYEDYCNHLRGHYSDEQWLVCEQCGKSSAHKSNFISHIAKHTNCRPFECIVDGNKCSVKTSTRQNLITHIKKVHKLVVTYPKQQCTKPTKPRARPHNRKQGSIVSRSSVGSSSITCHNHNFNQSQSGASTLSPTHRSQARPQLHSQLQHRLHPQLHPQLHQTLNRYPHNNHNGSNNSNSIIINNNNNKNNKNNMGSIRSMLPMTRIPTVLGATNTRTMSHTGQVKKI